jgi:hypothetical protein
MQITWPLGWLQLGNHKKAEVRRQKEEGRMVKAS